MLGKLSLLFEHYTTAQTRLNAHLATIRQHFKSVRTREEALADLKARKRSLGSKIESVEKKLAKMGPENKELMKTTTQLKELRGEMESIRVELMQEEAAIGDFKRRTAKEAMGIKCGGLLEFAEKITVVAEIGKLLIEEIPLQQTKPGMPRDEYEGYPKTDQLMQEATRCIADVGFAPAGAGGTPGIGGANRSDYNGGVGQYHPGDDSIDAYNTQLDTPYDTTHTSGGFGGGAEEDEGAVPTPIYATHSSLNKRDNTLDHDHDDPSAAATETPHQSTAADLPEDSAAEEWRQSKQVPVPATTNGDGYETYHTRTESSSHHPIADRFASPKTSSVVPPPQLSDMQASTSPDERQVGGSAPLRLVGAQGSQESLQEAYQNEPSRYAGALPPRLRTPPPVIDSPTTTAPPAALNQDDQSYFHSIGSTRAAQEAARRSYSPAPPSMASHSIASLGQQTPNSGYETAPEGRKMTAAAFRKGFARTPSAQHMSTTNSHSSAAQDYYGGGGGYNGAGIDRPNTPGGSSADHGAATAPLAIRKRMSLVAGQENLGPSYVDESPAAPPYQYDANNNRQQQQHPYPSAAYGGYE